MIGPKTLATLFYKAGYNTINHDGIEHAGYLAFLGLLALFPFLVFVVAIAGFMGTGQAGTEFVNYLFSYLPQHVVNGLRPRIEEITSGPPQGLLTVAILGAIWTASSAVEGYRTVLNRAYHVETPPAYIWRRLLSIAQLLIFSFILVICMILLVVTPIIWHKLETTLGFSDLSSTHGNFSNYFFIITLFVMFIGVSNLYYILPNIKQRWVSVFPGALIVVFLWLASASLFSSYLSHFDQVNLIYGSLGGIIAALLFFYIINVIFIYGAEFNYLLMKALGDHIIQKDGKEALDS